METENDSLAVGRPFRFGLKSLLISVAAIGVFLAPVQWFGGAYLFSASLTAGLVIACILAQRSSAPWMALGVAIAGAVAGLMVAIGALVYFFHALLNVVLCLLLLAFGVRPRTFAVAVTGLALGVYGFAMWEGAAGIRRIVALKKAYPLVSLRDRLAFQRTGEAAASKASTPRVLARAVSENLDEQDNQITHTGFYSRARALRELHEDTTRLFARAAGFGVMRMPSVYPELVELEPRERISMPVPVPLALDGSKGKALSQIHQDSVFDFLDPDRLGYVRNADAVAGFNSHGFSSLTERWVNDSNAPVAWQVSRLELVGLLRHKEPQVYVTNTLPAMDQLAEIPRRALNDFEERSLPQLEASEDVVVEAAPSHVRMLGAIRAGTSCLTCHDVERGRLLGAFTYSIEAIWGAPHRTASAEGR